LKEELPSVAEFAKGTRDVRDKMLEKILAKAEELDGEIYALLFRTIQRKGVDELMGIYLHYYGEGEILNGRIAERLKLSLAQKTGIADSIEQDRIERSFILSQIALGQDLKEKQMNSLLLIRSNAVNVLVRKHLTSSQLKELTSLKSNEIRFSDGQPFSQITFGW
jgi:hypothetical protein